MYPQSFGVPLGVPLVFAQTKNGYVAVIDENTWIGMPASLVEQHPSLFKYQRKHLNNGLKYEVVGRNRTPAKTTR